MSGASWPLWALWGTGAAFTICALVGAYEGSRLERAVCWRTYQRRQRAKGKGTIKGKAPVNGFEPAPMGKHTIRVGHGLYIK